jgi:hypothetical protein
MSLFDPVNSNIIPTPNLSPEGLPISQDSAYDLDNQSYAFNRQWLVQIISPFSGPVSYDSLRTTFDIEKTAFATANKGTISLYNLNDQSRSDYLMGARMSLALGYAGIGGPLIPIFSYADIWRVTHSRKGADIITTLESGEGERNLQESIFNQSFPANTPVASVLQALITAMGLTQGPMIGVPSTPYNSALALSGACRDIMDKIVVKELGLRWWVDGQTVKIAPPGTQLSVDAVLVSVDTGLIGTPNLGGPNGGDNVITFVSLINPALVPGAAVSIVSKFTTKTAIIKTSKFSGDTHESKWTVTCECTPMVAQQVSSSTGFAGSIA